MKIKTSFSSQEVSLKVLLGEIFVLTGGLTVAGYLVNPSDPLLISKNVSYLLIILMVITLYYGLGAGLVALSVAIPLVYYWYEPFPATYLLWHLLLVLIMGEFQFYWKKQTEKARLKVDYLEDKLDDMAKSFILLKTSHDQLERNYLIRPVSLRGIISGIRKTLAGGDRRHAYGVLMRLIADNFNLEEASLYGKTGNTFERIASVGKDVPMELDDPLVQKAIEEGRVCYVSMLNMEEERSRYLAVVPVVEEDAKALLLIKEMPFTSLNKDNLFLFYLLLYYLYKEETVLKDIRPLMADFDIFPADFLKEVKRHHDLYTHTGVESTVVVFYIRETPLETEVVIRENLRALDMACRITLDGGMEAYVTILPFAGPQGAASFLERMKKRMISFMGMDRFASNVNYRVLNLKESPDEVLRTCLDVSGGKG